MSIADRTHREERIWDIHAHVYSIANICHVDEIAPPDEK